MECGKPATQGGAMTRRAEAFALSPAFFCHYGDQNDRGCRGKILLIRTLVSLLQAKDYAQILGLEFA